MARARVSALLNVFVTAGSRKDRVRFKGFLIFSAPLALDASIALLVLSKIRGIREMVKLNEVATRCAGTKGRGLRNQTRALLNPEIGVVSVISTPRIIIKSHFHPAFKAEKKLTDSGIPDTGSRSAEKKVLERTITVSKIRK